MIPEIEWDDCYPTDQSLDAARAAPLDFRDAQEFLRRELAQCAEMCVASYQEEDGADFLGRQVLKLFFSTGGWSGAEDLMHVVESRFDTRHYMVQWNRGGHYIFEIPKPETGDENGV